MNLQTKNVEETHSKAYVNPFIIHNMKEFLLRKLIGAIMQENGNVHLTL